MGLLDRGGEKVFETPTLRHFHFERICPDGQVKIVDEYAHACDISTGSLVFTLIRRDDLDPTRGVGSISVVYNGAEWRALRIIDDATRVGNPNIRTKQ